MSQAIPTTVSPGLQRELTSAVDRTGWTPQLEHAARMLPFLVKLKPEQVEQYSAEIYRRMA